MLAEGLLGQLAVVDVHAPDQHRLFLRTGHVDLILEHVVVHRQLLVSRVKGMDERVA
jgi:hypothetical protein